MNPVLLLSAAGGLLGVVLFMLLVPPRLSRGLAVGLALLVITIGVDNGAPEAVWQVSAVVASAILILSLVRSRAIRSGGVRFWVVAGWLAYLVLGILLTGSWPLTWMVIYFSLAGLMAWVAARIDPIELRLVYSFVAIAAAVQVAIAVLEITVLPEPIWGYVGGIRWNPLTGDELARTQGTLGHPIPFAIFCGFAFIVAWSNPARWTPKVRLINLSVATTGIALSGTRSAILSIAAGILVHIALNGSLAKWLRSVVVLIAVGIVLLNIDIGIVRIAEDLLDSGSWTHRLGALVSVPALLDRPPGESWFGNGFGSIVQLYDRGLMQQIYLETVDNMLVYALGTMGIVGAIVLLALSVVTFALSDRTVRAIVVMVFAMYFSFDVWTWINIGVLVCMFMVLPRSDRSADGLVLDRSGLVARAGVTP